MELMVVSVILGIIAGFAIPNYNTAIERSHRRDAENQLRSIYAADSIYRAQNNSYWPAANGQLIAAINSGLGLNIIANGMTYTCNCRVACGSDFSCTATRNGWTLTVTEAALGAGNPSCTAGVCP